MVDEGTKYDKSHHTCPKYTDDVHVILKVKLCRRILLPRNHIRHPSSQPLCFWGIGWCWRYVLFRKHGLYYNNAHFHQIHFCQHHIWVPPLTVVWSFHIVLINSLIMLLVLDGNTWTSHHQKDVEIGVVFMLQTGNNPLIAANSSSCSLQIWHISALESVFYL